jgi:hypothetical protein
MERKERIKYARMGLALASAWRWQQRAYERAGSQIRYLADGPRAADAPERAADFLRREALRSSRRSVEPSDSRLAPSARSARRRFQRVCLTLTHAGSGCGEDLRDAVGQE